MPGAVSWELSPKQLAAFEARLARFQGAPLRDRMQKASLAAARYMVAPIKAAAPVGPTGNLRKSVKARQSKASVLGRGVSFGAAARIGGSSSVYRDLSAVVGPTAPHRHLIIRGHRIVTRLGRDTGQRSRANPFVDDAVRRHQDRAMAIVRAALFDGRSSLGSAGPTSLSRFKGRKSFAPR